MSITRFAISQNRLTFALLFVVFAAGVMAYFSLPRAEDPGFIIRTATVQTLFPGASPERVELLVTDKLEKAIQEIPELDFVTSQSATGVSLIFVNVDQSYKEMRPIWDNLRRKVERVAPDLPEGIIGPTVNDEFGDVFGIIVTITGDGLSYAELRDVADDVRDDLLRLPDAAKVEINGAQEERIFVEYNNARLAELGISTMQLRQLLEARNIINPGGAVETLRERIVLEPSGNFESVDDLRQTVISLPGSSDLVYLSDIATVTRGYVDPPSELLRYNGQRALALGISLREGGNIINLGEQVRAAVARLQQQYPIGIDLDFLTFQPDVVNKKVRNFTSSLGQAVGIVMIMILIALGIRTGLIVSAFIPACIAMSLALMAFFGIGINQISLAALIIALGLLVDNAIVMAEYILVRIQSGMDRVEAAVASARELAIPLLTGSLTTIAAFLPIYLAESNTGEYTAPLFQVVSIALLSSWILSLTVTPMLCVLLIKVKPATTTKQFGGRTYRTYARILTFMLRRRLVTIATTLLVFFGAMWGLGFVPSAFFPPSEVPIITAEFDLAPGTKLDYTDRFAAEVDAFIRDSLSRSEVREGVTHWGTFVGTSAPRFVLTYNPGRPDRKYVILIATTSSRPYADSVVAHLEQWVARNHPGVTPDIKPLALGPPVAAPIQVRLSGKDLERLYEIAAKLEARLAEHPGTRNIRNDWGAQTKKLVVNIDEARAKRAGVSNQDIAVSLQTVLSGITTTEYREGDKVIPVVLRSVAADRTDVGKIESMNVYAQATGRNVPLKQVADVELVWQPSEMIRRDRLKTITISADVAEGVVPTDVNAWLTPWLESEMVDWPIGYLWEYGGEIESSVEAQESIGAKLPFALFAIVLLLVWQFNSFRKPLIILLTIPLGMIGVTIGLLVSDLYMGFMTLLGVIALAGVVINNAIVLLDRIKVEQDENGFDGPTAIVQACLQRLRPIYLSNGSTIAGLFPLWWGDSPMFWPMAVAMIFGLAFATLLTLGVVPVLYSLFFGVRLPKGWSYQEPMSERQVTAGN